MRHDLQARRVHRMKHLEQTEAETQGPGTPPLYASGNRPCLVPQTTAKTKSPLTISEKNSKKQKGVQDAILYLQKIPPKEITP